MTSPFILDEPHVCEATSTLTLYLFSGYNVLVID